MKKLLIGFMFGVVLATAGGVWAWGHTRTDRNVRDIKDLLERQEAQRKWDQKPSLFAAPPCP